MHPSLRQEAQSCRLNVVLWLHSRFAYKVLPHFGTPQCLTASLFTDGLDSVLSDLTYVHLVEFVTATCADV